MDEVQKVLNIYQTGLCLMKVYNESADYLLSKLYGNNPKMIEENSFLTKFMRKDKNFTKPQLQFNQLLL